MPSASSGSPNGVKLKTESLRTLTDQFGVRDPVRLRGHQRQHPADQCGEAQGHHEPAWRRVAILRDTPRPPRRYSERARPTDGGLGSLMSSTAVVAAGLYETSGVDASLEELKSINHNLVSLQQPSKTCSGNEQSGKQTARRRC
jgi:hypothetical protein